jgi:phosphate-selective porin OprO and OprP
MTNRPTKPVQTCCFFPTDSIINQSIAACHQIEKLDVNNCVPVSSGLARTLRAESCLSLNVLSEKTGMKNSPTRTMTAKRIAVAVAAVCATMSAPSFAAGKDVKALMDLLLKKGVITQQEYDQNIQAAAENEAFKEKRLADDVKNLNNIAIKNKDTGSVMKSGLGMQSTDGETTVQLTGRVHMDYRSYGGDKTGTFTTDTQTDALEVRRARLGVRGQLFKDWKYEIVGNYGAAETASAPSGMSSTTTEIDVSYIDYAKNPAASVRLGKFKMPFSLEQLTSSNNIDFMERSVTNQNEGEFVPAKETGVMLFGSPVSGLSYGVALSRGRTSANTKTATYDKPDYIGRVSANLPKVFLGRDDFILHAGLGLSKGEIAGLTTSSNRNEIRTSSGFYTALTPLVGPVNRTRLGYEGAVAYKAFKLQGEMFNYRYEGPLASNEIESNYIQAVYNLTGENHNYSNSAGTFGWIKPNVAFDKGGMGAIQVGIRASSLKAPDVAPRTSTFATSDYSSITYGVTWFLNDNARLMLNYTEIDYGGIGVGASASRYLKERAMMMRGQLSF